MSLTLGLGAAISGLMTSQKGLDLVSQNIANANTVGYTRKEFNQESRVLAGKGAGVEVGLPTRNIDKGLIRSILKEGGTLGTYQTLDKFYARIQDLFGTPGDNSSVSHIVAALGDEFESLGVSPDSSTAQSSTIDAAVRTAEKLNTMTREIQELRGQADRDVADNITTINALLADIANLNNKVVHDQAIGAASADLEDKRDEAIKKVASFLDVQTFPRENGAVMVYTSAGAPLVDNTAITLTHTALTTVSAEQTMAASNFTAISANHVDITSSIRRGALKGAIDLRDTVLPNMQAELDELSRNMRDQINLVHNRGVSYPDMQHATTGSRTFSEPATSTLTFGAADTVVTVFDTSGNQVATTTMKTELGGAGPFTVNAVAAAIQTWLQSAAAGDPNLGATATAAITNSHLAIDLGTGTGATYSLAFRDEAVVAVGETIGSGATAQDVSLSFNHNAAGIADETVSGFSNFFGLNDLYVTERANSTWDSKIMSATDTAGVAATLDFRLTTGSIDTIAINANDTLTTIAANINADATLGAAIKATVVPEGGGFRLRLLNLDNTNTEMYVTSSVATNLDLRRSESGTAGLITVRTDIGDAPSKTSRGAVLYNTDTSEYYVSAGDNTTANQLADLATNPVAFRVAGNISGTSRTFSDHAATFLSLTASATASNRTSLDYQTGLHSSLVQKSAEISAVNLDEELSKLMMYEHAYAAAAKVISTTAQMLEVLNDMVR